MELVPGRPNVELRAGAGGEPIVVLAFPYDARIVDAVRTIPYRRFDWDTKEWWAPADDWAGVHVAEILRRFPELTTSGQADAWLAGLETRWVGHVKTMRHGGRGWWVLETRAGTVPDALADGAVARAGHLLVPFTRAAAAALRGLEAARLDAAADRCLVAVEHGEAPPPARLTLVQRLTGDFLELEVLWDRDAALAFRQLPAAGGERSLPLDPWLVDDVEGFLAAHGVVPTAAAEAALATLRAEAATAAAAIRRSRATAADPLADTAAALGGTLEPFQWAAVRYALEARRTFLADEQGLGKTVEALATLEADGAFPAIVVCPASLKLNWRRETEKWLPARTVAVAVGRGALPPPADLTILNYEIVAAHREALARRRPVALVIDESHYVKNPQAKRTQAVRRLAAAVPEDGLRLALTGTPVLNHADELIAQLRVLGRLEDFGSGARFSRQFQGVDSEERLHWHLRRRCFVRRRKAEVLPQLPAKRQVVVPIALENEAEYRLAERDVIAWLREQPLDLSELDAKIAATLRAERLAQLTALTRLAARGKLAGAVAWIHDFLASGEPLVVFARHVEVQRAVLERFPHALHLLGADSAERREGAVRAFQAGEGSPLLVAATRVAGQGITLTRASNVAFLELEWTPALHDQAEDRCHRIGQRDAVTAWYLLAAETIDETMAALIARKREIVAAVTDGDRREGDGMVDAVVRALRDGEPFRRLRPVA